MKQFRYRAKKSPTDIREGSLPANTADEVIAKLNEMGLIAVNVEPVSEEAASAAHAAVNVEHHGLNGREVTHFYRQLGRILKSGVPILPALRLVGEQADYSKLRDAITKVRLSVEEGHPFSQALASLPAYFSPFDIAVLESGELVGRLDESLDRISVYRMNQEKLFSKIRGALAYPAFVFFAGLLAVLFMLVYVMPRFSAFFLDLGQDLPFLTRVLITVSAWSEKGWPLIVCAGAIVFWLVKRSLDANEKQSGWHRFYLSIPKIGKLIVYAQFVRFARTLSMLLECGIPLLRGMQTAQVLVTNQIIRRDLQQAHARVAEGATLTEALRDSAWVPTFVLQLIRSGEESGRLQESLNDIADWYEQELQENFEMLTKLLEPTLILVVGSVLGLMIIAILLPVFNMNAAIS